ncbi:MAG: amidohydrolase family protein [Gammaproteobacteria bacterium]|nr:amidohydrolase family protein [Gammaproteobacteria bacterium]
MTYAGNLRVNDADSHLMELPDFLTSRADPEFRDDIAGLLQRDLGIFELGTYAGQQGHTAKRRSELAALGDNLTRGPKWHGALGAFSGEERGQALDLLGFRRQVIFSSFCARPIFAADSVPLRYAAARAHNRSMADFCREDARLIGVAMVTLDEPDRTVAEIEAALKLGLGAVWIPSEPPGGRSPGHPLHDPVWALLAESGVPFILHVGSSDLNVPDPWMNDGRPEQKSARGGAEVIGSKDLTCIHHSAHRFVSVLVLDGVLERHRRLCGGVIELGAGWVPDMIRRLDHAAAIWARSEPHLAEMTRTPGEQVREQLRFTPYPFEDVGQMVSESFPELYLFSSDYPHAEGGRDPIGRFERSTERLSPAERELFFHRNFETLYPP